MSLTMKLWEINKAKNQTKDKYQKINFHARKVNYGSYVLTKTINWKCQEKRKILYVIINLEKNLLQST